MTEALWDTVDLNRALLSDRLHQLSAADWETPSLCTGWAVRDVVGHLSLIVVPRPQLLTLVVRYPGRTNAFIRKTGIHMGRSQSTDELLAAVDRSVGYHRPMPGLSACESLIDILGHTMDVRLPLGDRYTLDPEHALIAATRVLGYRKRRHRGVFSHLPLAELRLSATDYAWSHGDGKEVRGSMSDLFMLVIGRQATLPNLQGEGADLLRSRLSRAVA